MAVESKGIGVCARLEDGLPNKTRLLLSSRTAVTNDPSFGEKNRIASYCPADRRPDYEAIG